MLKFLRPRDAAQNAPSTPDSAAPKQERIDPRHTPEAEQVVSQIEEKIVDSEGLLGGLDRLAREEIITDPAALDEIYARQEVGREKPGKADASAFEEAGAGLRVKNAIVRVLTLGLAGSSDMLRGDGIKVDKRKLKTGEEDREKALTGVELFAAARKYGINLSEVAVDSASPDFTKKLVKSGAGAEKVILRNKTEGEADRKAREILNRELDKLVTGFNLDPVKDKDLVVGPVLVREKTRLETFKKQKEQNQDILDPGSLAKLEAEEAVRQTAIDEKQEALNNNLEVIREPLSERRGNLIEAISGFSALLGEAAAREDGYKQEIKGLEARLRRIQGAKEIAGVLGDEVKGWEEAKAQAEVNLKDFREKKESLNKRLTALKKNQAEVEKTLNRINAIGKTPAELRAEREVERLHQERLKQDTGIAAAQAGGAKQILGGELVGGTFSSGDLAGNALSETNMAVPPARPAGRTPRPVQITRPAAAEAGVEPIREGEPEHIGDDYQDNIAREKRRIELDRAAVEERRRTEADQTETQLGGRAGGTTKKWFRPVEKIGSRLKQPGAEASRAAELGPEPVRKGQWTDDATADGLALEIDNERKNKKKRINKIDQHVNEMVEDDQSADTDDLEARASEERAGIALDQAADERRKIALDQVEAKGGRFRKLIGRWFRPTGVTGRLLRQTGAETASAGNPAVEAPAPELGRREGQRAEKREIEIVRPVRFWLNRIFGMVLEGGAAEVMEEYFREKGKPFDATAPMTLNLAMEAYTRYLMKLKGMDLGKAVSTAKSHFEKSFSTSRRITSEIGDVAFNLADQIERAGATAEASESARVGRGEKFDIRFTGKERWELGRYGASEALAKARASEMPVEPVKRGGKKQEPEDGVGALAEGMDAAIAGDAPRAKARARGKKLRPAGEREADAGERVKVSRRRQELAAAARENVDYEDAPTRTFKGKKEEPEAEAPTAPPLNSLEGALEQAKAQIKVTGDKLVESSATAESTRQELRAKLGKDGSLSAKEWIDLFKLANISPAIKEEVEKNIFQSDKIDVDRYNEGSMETVYEISLRNIYGYEIGSVASNELIDHFLGRKTGGESPAEDKEVAPAARPAQEWLSIFGLGITAETRKYFAFPGLSFKKTRLTKEQAVKASVNYLAKFTSLRRDEAKKLINDKLDHREYYRPDDPATDKKAGERPEEATGLTHESARLELRAKFSQNGFLSASEWMKLFDLRVTKSSTKYFLLPDRNFDASAKMTREQATRAYVAYSVDVDHLTSDKARGVVTEKLAEKTATGKEIAEGKAEEKSEKINPS